MRLKAASWSELRDRHERDIARIAHMALVDTIFGGPKALVYAKRLKDMGGRDLEYVVNDVYSASSGNASVRHSAWECPECGNPHLGQEAARNCCYSDE